MVSTNKSVLHSLGFTMLITTSGAALIPLMAAENTQTSCVSSLWSNASCWVNGIPATNDDALLTYGTAMGFNTTANVYNLTIDNGSTLNQTGGELASRNWQYIGLNGTGTFTQTAGTNNSDSLLVGYETGSRGTYNLYGGTLSSGSSWIGADADAVGTVNIDGIDSHWRNNRYFGIGASGTGMLNITNGGTLSTNVTGVGQSRGGTGIATIDGTGSSWINSSNLTVGDSGTGTLAITSGGTVTNTAGILGRYGSTGTATIDGAGSSWINSSYLYVGQSGTGTLNIINGGTVSNTAGYLRGYLRGYGSTATIDGTNSNWTNSSALTVGTFGTLAISNGGTVSSATSLLSGGTATIDGTDSNWSNSGALTVGKGSRTSTLNINNSGTVTNTNGYLGFDGGSTGTATIDGTDSNWMNSGTLTVGVSGTGTLNINNGGTVSNTDGYLGQNAGSEGTTTIDGIGSKWTNSSTLTVGGSGTGTLAINNGGMVSNTDGYLGQNAGSTSTATVDGNDSDWINSGKLTVGVSGTGTLNINSGGTVTNSDGYLGQNAGSIGTASINGIDSNWNNNGALTVGESGTGTVNLNGGTHSITSDLIMGHNSSSSSTYNLNGGTLNVGGNIVKGAGTSQLNIDGGTLNLMGSSIAVDNFNIGNATGSRGSFTLDGGKTVTADNVNVGNYNFYSYPTGSATGTLNINNGKVDSTSGFITRGTATIDGIDSSWINSGDLTVGKYYGSGTLNITNGGTVTNAAGLIGYQGRGTATIDGVGSSWTNNGTLTIGDSFSLSYTRGTLNITNGGTVSNTDAYLGYKERDTGTATVDGAGSNWFNSGTLTVGGSGSGTLNIKNGGTVSNTDAYLGSNTDGYLNSYNNYGIDSHGTVTIDGINSKWINTGSLTVGVSGSGTVTLNGGTHSITSDLILALPSVSGCVSIYACGGIYNLNGGKLNVGGNIVNGAGISQLNINGGTVNVGGNIVNGTGTSELNIDGGTLNLMGSSIAVDNFNIANTRGSTGSFTLNSGKTVTADNVNVGVYGTLNNNGGTMIVANQLEYRGYFGGGLNINNGGTVSSDSGYLRFGTATIDGIGSSWNISNDLHVATYGRYGEAREGGARTLNINNRGSVIVGNALTIELNSTVNLNSGELNASIINATASSAQFNFTGGTLVVDTFNGNLVNAGGTLAPGNSPGVTTINGDYTQLTSGIFGVEIGGMLSGTQYDVLNITGIGNLAGTLNVDFYDMGNGLFSASLGDTFNILSAESLYGEFDILNLATLGDGLGWQLDYLIDYLGSTDFVQLSVVSSALSAVPTPASIWLFGSGLLALAGVARRRKS
jgi:fibronectin-binding autotransporter adhesin